MSNKYRHPTGGLVTPCRVEWTIVDMRVGDKNVLLVPGDEHHARAASANEPRPLLRHNALLGSTTQCDFGRLHRSIRRSALSQSGRGERGDVDRRRTASDEIGDEL